MKESRVIVSFASGQTVPNYLFIKEVFKPGDELLFVVTSEMQSRIEWILNTLKLSQDFVTVKFSYVLIKEEDWDEMRSSVFEVLTKERSYLVNLSGGTKYMALAMLQVFKDFNSDFFYIPLPKNYYYQLSNDGRLIDRKLINYRMNILEYFSVHNVSCNHPQNNLLFPDNYTRSFFELYTKQDGLTNRDFVIIDQLRLFRNKKHLILEDLIDKPTSNTWQQIPDIEKFLEKINFNSEKEGQLNKYEIQYITGGWFEEYIYILVNKYLKPNDSLISIKTGSNELDVVFTLGNKLFIIECKTGLSKEGLFRQTVYKATALRETMTGLSGFSYIFSLSPDKENQFSRIAKNMNITYVDRSWILDDSRFQELMLSIQNRSFD